MKITPFYTLKKSDLKDFSVVLVFADRQNLWSDSLKRENFSADFKKTCVIWENDRKFLFIGLGQAGGFNLDKFATVMGEFARQCEELKKLKVNLVIPRTSFSDLDLGKAISESINLALYKFEKYKTTKKEFSLEEINLFLDGFTGSRIKSLNRGLEMGNLFSVAVNYARDLVNEPASVTTPSYLASEAVKLQKLSDKIEVTVFDAKKMKKMGMDASLVIGKGSVEEPKFIKIEYKPRKSYGKIVLVGKGLTFDSGGLSIKTASAMETMKIDMSGAAAVIATFKVLEKLNVTANVIGLIVAVENMPSGSSVRPGDVVRAYNGKTVEILNTDAEGRVTLADSLSYAASLKPKYIIDIATLTGACVVALGEEVSGVMGNSPELTQKIIAAGRAENEKSWELPLVESYREMLKSNVADVKNTTKKYGGAITAGMFLEEFVDKIPWVHMDVAGPVWQEKETDLIARGATGIPVKTLLRFLISE